MNWIAAGALLAALAVAAGAFGAHGLERRFAAMYSGEIRFHAGAPVPAAQKMLADFETGVRYHLLHALALVLVGILLRQRPAPWAERAAWCFLAGIVLFSGSLYLYTIGGASLRKLLLVTPLGGALFIGGWCCVVVSALRRSPDPEAS